MRAMLHFLDSSNQEGTQHYLGVVYRSDFSILEVLPKPMEQPSWAIHGAEDVPSSWHRGAVPVQVCLGHGQAGSAPGPPMVTRIPSAVSCVPPRRGPGSGGYPPCSWPSRSLSLFPGGSREAACRVSGDVARPRRRRCTPWSSLGPLFIEVRLLGGPASHFIEIWVLGGPRSEISMKNEVWELPETVVH